MPFHHFGMRPPPIWCGIFFTFFWRRGIRGYSVNATNTPVFSFKSFFLFFRAIFYGGRLNQPLKAAILVHSGNASNTHVLSFNFFFFSFSHSNFFYSWYEIASRSSCISDSSLTASNTPNLFTKQFFSFF